MAAPLQLEDRVWQATAIAGEDGDVVAVIEGTTPHLRFEQGRVSGDASCNRFFGPYEEGEGGALTFGELATTMMACLESVMVQEQDFLAALAAVDSISIAGYTLEMRAGDDVVALFTAVPATLANSAWRLTALNNGKEAVVSLVLGTEITATFTEDGTLAGSSGCNSYRATWTTDGEAIAIGPPMGTKKMCPGEGVMEQEARYLEVLGLATRFRLEVKTLEMFDDAGARQLEYFRADE